MTQIGVIGSSRTLTGSRLATKTILVKSVISQAGKSRKCHPPNIKNPNICFRPKRRAPKNDADWCNRFVQNSDGEPIGDKNDSWAITAEAVMGCCNLNELLK